MLVPLLTYSLSLSYKKRTFSYLFLLFTEALLIVTNFHRDVVYQFSLTHTLLPPPLDDEKFSFHRCFFVLCMSHDLGKLTRIRETKPRLKSFLGGTFFPSPSLSLSLLPFLNAMQSNSFLHASFS